MKKKNSLVITGITSLFLIFSVLCLVILSLLSLGTSRSDLAMSKQTAEQTAEYYNACNEASEICLEMEEDLWEIYVKSEDSISYFDEVGNLPDTLTCIKDTSANAEGNISPKETALQTNSSVSYAFCLNNINWDTETRQITMEIPFSDSQSLFVCLDILYPESDDDTVLQTETWKTIVTGTWNPDNKQHIYQGE